MDLRFSSSTEYFKVMGIKSYYDSDSIIFVNLVDDKCLLVILYSGSNLEKMFACYNLLNHKMEFEIFSNFST